MGVEIEDKTISMKVSKHMAVLGIEVCDIEISTLNTIRRIVTCLVVENTGLEQEIERLRQEKPL